MHEPIAILSRVRIRSGYYVGQVGIVRQVTRLLVPQLWIVTVEVVGVGLLKYEPDGLENIGGQRGQEKNAVD